LVIIRPADHEIICLKGLFKKKEINASRTYSSQAYLEMRGNT